LDRKEVSVAIRPHVVNIQIRTSMAKLRIIAEYLTFLKENKKWWLLPIVVMLLLFALLIVLTKGSALAPFIYTIF
jgi:hypothetical protein